MIITGNAPVLTENATGVTAWEFAPFVEARANAPFVKGDIFANSAKANESVVHAKGVICQDGGA